jgi:acetyl-CoA acetyltransferase
MIYDAPCSLPGASFAHLPIYGFEDLGFVRRGKAGAFIAERNTVPGGKLPLNTNGGASPTCTPACTYCRRACARCAASPPRQIPGAKISVCHGVGGMLAASGPIIMPNEAP